MNWQTIYLPINGSSSSAKLKSDFDTCSERGAKLHAARRDAGRFLLLRNFDVQFLESAAAFLKSSSVWSERYTVVTQAAVA
jgi:hypothetical protein